MNVFVVSGRIPFDLEIKNGDDDKKAFLGFAISTQRDYKPEGEKYYPEDLLYCKAFGAKAQFIDKHWKKGDVIEIIGRVERDDDYKDKDGNDQKGQMYVKVTEVKFVPRGSNSGDSEGGSTKKTETKAPAEKAPAKSNPLAGKKRPF